LSDEDKTDIISKLEDKGEEVPAEEPMAENGEYMVPDRSIARFSASGGHTIGENTINEHILSILEKARQNVKNNLNK
jgi:hypothetical protein